ncbi:anks1b [Symbiodinium sp. CCMP2456]|nr:anks1b [Symbiodinium sp. CCMP2456]
MLFPMYTVAVELVLEMTEVLPHEELKAKRQLTVFEDDVGARAAFVSHQWVARHHPDPEFAQMSVLQRALQRLLARNVVPIDLATETYLPTATPLPMREFQTSSLFLWYDYFSVPQLEQCDQAKAINSIPAYVAKCVLFLVLCPTIECPSASKVLGALTWSQRGWCALERTARELSPCSSWILIQSSTCVELVGGRISFPRVSVGEGNFAKEEDRQKLAPVMRNIVMSKIMHCLRVGDLPGFRIQFNAQSVYLRGLDVEPVSSILPDNNADQADIRDAVGHFLYQNGLTKINEADSGGWWPLHYAALAGKAEVVRGLLQQRAAVNQRTSKEVLSLGVSRWVSALDVAVLFKRHEAARLLISARANLEGGIVSAMQCAAAADSREAIKMLCAAEGKPLARDLIGISSFDTASSFNCQMAVDELVAQAQLNPLVLSKGLHIATFFRGGSADLVQYLLDLQADIDFRFDMKRDYSRLGRLLVGAKALQYRLGKATALSTLAYHIHGSTPLMQAVRSAQYEAAATLIACGAQLELRNCRGWTAADFAEGQSIPRFLQKGLDGDRSECKQVASLALKHGTIEVVL